MSLFKPETVLPQYIRLEVGVPPATQIRTHKVIQQKLPSSFVRQVTDALEITEKLVTQRRIIEKFVNENLLTEYDERNGNIIRQGLLELQNGKWVARRTIPYTASLLVKNFIRAYENVYKIADYVKNEYDFNVEKGIEVHKAFVKAILDAKLQFKMELNQINNKLL